MVDAERVSSLDARLTYLALHLAERRASLTDSNAVLAEQLADLARRRLDAGEINVLEYNTAVLESARARSLADRSEGERRAVAAHLGRVVGLSGDSTMITSPLPPLPAPPRDPNGSQAVALQRRPDMQAASLEVEAAGKTLTESRLRVVPNLELSLFNGKEEGTDDLLGLLLGFSIPLFHRGQANVGAARADQIAAEAVSDATDRLIRAEVEAGASRYAGAYDAERRFVGDLLLAARQNAELAALAFQEGELGIADVVVVRSTSLATQLEYLEVLAAAYSAWFELAAALNARPGELMNVMGGGE